MSYINEFLAAKGWLYTVVPFALAIALQTLATLLRNRFASDNLASFRVTLLGPPGAGKTSAVIAVLDYMINSRMSGYLRLRGSSTIDNVEEGVLLLNQGLFPARTVETSTNVYRLDYFPPLPLLTKIVASLIPVPKAYRVEIADFAGELTDSFVEPHRDLKLSNIPANFSEDASSNYLKWVAESDRCLLFIDMERYVSEGSAFADALTTKYVAFWQRYLDLHATRMRPQAGTPVIIVHSKCDVITRNNDSSHSPTDVFQARMLAREEASGDFDRLYKFMRLNSRDVQIVFISVTLKSGGGTRMGVDELASAVLPNRRRTFGRA